MSRTVEGTISARKRATSPVRHVLHPGESLTLKAAADLLNVDRSYLAGLLDAGRIPFTGTGLRRHVRREDLLAFKRERDALRREGLRALTRMSQEAGMDDADYRVLLPDPS